MKKPRVLLTATAFLLLAACGSSRDLAPIPDSSSLTPAVDTSSDSSASADFAAAIPNILKGIEDIKQEIKGLQISPSAGSTTTGTTKPSTGTGSTGTTGTTKPSTGTTTGSTGTTGTTKPSTGSGSTSSGSTGSSAGNAADDAAAKGKAELLAVMNKIQSSAYVTLTAEKNEKNLKTGKVSFNKIKMSSRQPNLVRIDIIQSSSGSDGVSALYTSGVGNTIQIKKLFIKLDLSKTDDRVVSNNGYTGDKIDLFGVSSRMANGYDAQLVGTTQLNGTKLNVLKVTTKGTNSLDDRVGYEYLGYEPDTHAIRLWEAYDKSGGKDPFFRMALTEISFPSSMPDSTFKL